MRLHHISGDTMVFLYDHTEESPPRVGDSYFVRQIGSDDALVAQVVSLESFNYPSLSEVLMRQLMEESYGPGNVHTYMEPSNAPQVDNLGLANGKIRRRRLEGGDWSIWDGWLPSRNVTIERVQDEELLLRCGLGEIRHPLRLGRTLNGAVFSIEGRMFEKVNIITALKGMGKSHLAKVTMLELMRHGMTCVVFDVNREYNRLPRLVVEQGRVSQPGIVLLSASENFRVTIESFGRRALIRLFEEFSPTETTRNVFEQRVNEMFDQLERVDDGNARVPPEQQQPRPFVNIRYLRSRFPQPPATHETVHRAVMERLNQMEGLNPLRGHRRGRTVV